MPELPEVETVRRGLAPAMEGRVIARVELRRPDLRFPFPERFAERLARRRVVSCGRRAKYLAFDLDDGTVLVMHLGMSGSFLVAGDVPGLFHHERSRDAAHDHVVFHMAGDGEGGGEGGEGDGGTGAVRVTYNDPRRFGYMDLIPRAEFADHPWFRDLGPEPVAAGAGGNAFDAAGLARRLANKRTPIKAALLDQRVIAGLGNIYVCEALHRARISPIRMAGTLVRRDGSPSVRLKRLAEEIRAVIGEAIEAGGSSLRDHRQADGQMGYFQHTFRVYDREAEPCPTPGCHQVVRRMAQGGRSTFYCSSCQR